ncbi:UDP-N-acetylmuramate dehydrogenase [Balneola sp. MJW-20]|uniref:UDP-N-acetylmuramate dehydrogenase n=1 Tax=Gracilimonas aurantiaca TaxID=3234185 RepID=UPI0034AF0E1E
MMSPDPMVLENYDLRKHNTMGLAARCRYFAAVRSIEELKFILSEYGSNMEILILGGGSNILFKSDYDGLILNNQITGKDVVHEDDRHVHLKLGGGENWHQSVRWAVARGWGGIENLSLIPGSVGAAPIQNIGAYGVELEEVFVELEALEISTGKLRTFSKDECNFGYRDSLFKREEKGRYFIVSVTLRLDKDPEINLSYKALKDHLENYGISDPDIKDISEAVIQIRSSKLPDPTEIGNTGSFFKNPVISEKEFGVLKEQYPDIPSYNTDTGIKVPAAWLIEKAGWKGKRFGDAGVHKKQALVLVNYGNATGDEIWDLALRIQSSVQQKFSIQLQPEVNVI